MGKGRKPDTPEEALIRAEIIAKGLGGKLSPAMVLNVPKTELEPHVLEGKKDYAICKVFGVSAASINFLRKFYELPTAAEVEKMLECVETEPLTTMGEALKKAGIKPEPEVEQQGNQILYDGVPIAEAKPEVKASCMCDEFTARLLSEMGTIEKSVFDWSGVEPARIAYGIVAGVARMLREMDGEQVEVSVTVRRA